jgi:hypothetical protein
MVLAHEIPVAHTPKGGWKGEMPPPILANCTEPLPDDAFDMRGLWKAFAVEVDGASVDDISHVERVEQGGNRVVITSGGIIHDMVCDGTLENGVNDVSGFNSQPINVASTWEDGKHVLRPNNEMIAVTRELDGDVLIWSIIPLNRVTRMRRIDMRGTDQ